MLGESAQEVEARVFIERILTDPQRKAKLGKELAERCQAALDERIRDVLRTQGAERRDDLDAYSCVWQRRSRTLYQAAAEAAKALGE
jgi:hypothetical protein